MVTLFIWLAVREDSPSNWKTFENLKKHQGDLMWIKIYADPSKFYILSLGFSDIEWNKAFIIGVYLLYSYGVSFTGVQ